MPTYKFTAPNGQTIRITGDAPPSESELDAIFKDAGVSADSKGTLKTSPTAAAAKATSLSATARINPYDELGQSVADTKIGGTTIGGIGDDITDAGIGFAKGAGRMVQMIPGVARGTDALFGLPSGASANSMEATNTAQKIGGYGADAAAVAGGVGLAAEAAPMLSATAPGRFVSALAKEAMPSGKSAEELAALTAKYGKRAILGALGFGGAKWLHLIN